MKEAESKDHPRSNSIVDAILKEIQMAMNEAPPTNTLTTQRAQTATTRSANQFARRNRPFAINDQVLRAKQSVT